MSSSADVVVRAERLEVRLGAMCWKLPAHDRLDLVLVHQSEVPPVVAGARERGEVGGRRR